MQFPTPHYIGEDHHWRWLFYAQHHGLKTRLLDWTKNPLVALYFAVENILSGCSDQAPGAVWALHVHDKHFVDADSLGHPDEWPIRGWGMVNPPPITRRLADQSGLFTFHPEIGSNSISDAERRDKEALYKIEFDPDGDTAKTIRAALGIMSIHHGALFSDPQGIAAFINHEWPDIAPPPRQTRKVDHEGSLHRS